MPTIWDPWPGKTNASGDATGQGYQNAPSRSVFRYSHAVAKLRAYRQRERARGRARTHAAIEAATLRESAKRGYAGLAARPPPPGPPAPRRPGRAPRATVRRGRAPERAALARLASAGGR